MYLQVAIKGSPERLIETMVIVSVVLFNGLVEADECGTGLVRKARC
jgi:hypothetical protein